MENNQHRAHSRTLELVEPSPPGPVPGGLGRIESVWRPVLVKIASVAAGMLGLAGIGLFATLEANPNAGSSRVSSWLASSRTEVTANAAAVLPLALPTFAEPTPPADEGSPPTAPLPRSETPTPENEEPPAAPRTGLTPDGKVILNTANVDELQRLPGIGKKRAEKILELRAKLGRFRKPTDLLRVRGVGVKSLQRMLPHLVVDPPEPAPPESTPPK